MIHSESGGTNWSQGMSMESSTFEHIVRSYIELSGASYRDLGEAAGVHPSQISKFMKGERGLSSLSIGRIVDALGCQLLPPSRKFQPPTVGRPKSTPAPHVYQSRLEAERRIRELNK